MGAPSTSQPRQSRAAWRPGEKPASLSGLFLGWLLVLWGAEHRCCPSVPPLVACSRRWMRKPTSSQLLVPRGRPGRSPCAPGRSHGRCGATLLGQHPAGAQDLAATPRLLSAWLWRALCVILECGNRSPHKHLSRARPAAADVRRFSSAPARALGAGGCCEPPRELMGGFPQSIPTTGARPSSHPNRTASGLPKAPKRSQEPPLPPGTAAGGCWGWRGASTPPARR